MPDKPAGALTDEEMFFGTPRPDGALTDEEMFGGDPKPDKYSKLGSAGMGALQGFYGVADEAYGTGRALYDIATGPEELKDLVDTYNKRTGEARKEFKQAKKDNPYSYTGAEIGTGVASAFIPGLGFLNTAKGAKLGTTLGKGAITGAAAGWGGSEADSAGGIVDDTITGAGWGIGGAGAFRGLGAATNLVNPSWIGKKGANIILNTPEELTETYLKNKSGVMNAKKRHELVEPFGKLKEKLKQRTIQGSQAARKELEGIEFKGKDIGKIAGRMAGKVEREIGGKWNAYNKTFSKGMRTASNEEKATAARWLREMEAENKRTPTIKAGALKSEIQAMGAKNYGRKVGPGQFDTIDQGIKKRYQGILNKKLKDSSPAYKRDMPEVQRLTELLKKANELGTEKGLSNTFRRTQSDQWGAGQIVKAVLEGMDKTLGSNFLNDVKLSVTREAFDKSIQNGSMNVQKFRGLVEKIPILKHFAGFIGGSVDKYGRKMTMKALDLTILLDEQIKRQGVQNVKKFLEPLAEKAAQGNYSAAMALQMLEYKYSENRIK